MDEILDENISPEDLKKYESIYYKEAEANMVRKESAFNYAWCLVRSKFATDIRKGICMLESLYSEGSEKEKRDYLYYLVIGHGKLREYSKALEYARAFLYLEPGNEQVQHLEQVIKKRMEKEGLKGIAIASGAALVLGGVLSLVYAIAKK